MAPMPTQPTLPLFDAAPSKPTAAEPPADAVPSAIGAADTAYGDPAPGETAPVETGPVETAPMETAPTSAAEAEVHAITPVAPELPLTHPAPPPAAAPPPAKTRRPWWARLLGKLLEPWIRLDFEPQSPMQYFDGRPVCYVLEDYGLSNALILDRACREAGLPSPMQPMPGDPLGRKRAYVALSRRNANTLKALGVTPGPEHKTHSGSLARLLEAHRADPSLDVQLVPVSIFVGRTPDKQSGWFSVLFSENWTLVGRFRRLLAILLNGRDTQIQFAPPVPLRGIVAEGLDPERTVRKLSRVLRTHFRRIRAAVIGPDLSTRRLLADKVLASDAVKEAIADQARRDKSGNPARAARRRGKERTPTSGKSPPTIRTRWCARCRSC